MKIKGICVVKQLHKVKKVHVSPSYTMNTEPTNLHKLTSFTKLNRICRK
uniref:Uncharacterized protein n=1 Tax=Arundo donax TaxID=35708 RepID=A0A0A9DL13_ARUDO